MKIFAIFARILLLILISQTSYAGVYKCNVNGVVTFSEKPCGKDAKSVQIKHNSGPSGTQSFSGNERALMWTRDGVKTCTYYDTPEHAKNDYESAKQMAKKLESLSGAGANKEFSSLASGMLNSKLQNQCDGGAAAKCYDYRVKFNGIVEERYYTNDSAKLSSLQKTCSGGKGAKFMLLK